MNYGNIKKNDVANGTGVRVSLFVSGCTNNCPGCFNKEAQDFTYGQPFNDAALQEIFDELDRPEIEGLTILGGEPLEPYNQPGVYYIVHKVKEKYPNKNIWLYSGFDLSTVPITDFTYGILKNIDVMVDGLFEIDKKDPSLAFRGSSNQRIINMPETLKQEILILKENI